MAVSAVLKVVSALGFGELVEDGAFVVAEAPQDRAGGVFGCKDFVHGRSVQIPMLDMWAIGRNGRPIGVVNLQGNAVALIDIVEIIDPTRNRARTTTPAPVLTFLSRMNRKYHRPLVWVSYCRTSNNPHRVY